MSRKKNKKNLNFFLRKITYYNIRRKDMNSINIREKKKENIPAKVKHFLWPEKDEELFKQVEEYNHYATYSLDNSSSRSILNGLKDVASILRR